MSSSYTPSQRLRAVSAPKAADTRFGDWPDVPEGKIIMAIDDSKLIRGILTASFERVGLPVYGFESGLAAIRALTDGEVPIPDLILLDIGLPEMDGYDVAKVLRSHPDLVNTIIIMLTGRDGVWNRMRSKVVGAKDFISKPFKPSEMTAIVLRHLNLSLSESGLPDDVLS